MLAEPDRAVAIPIGWTCVGSSVCGTLGPDGDVSAPPQFGPNYAFITTEGAVGLNGAAINPPTGQETNGSLLESNTFTLAEGDRLSFYFNYVTSDGSQFTEYAWTGLFNVNTLTSGILFTARTTTSGDTVPGFGLPGLDPNVVLTPPTTPIIAGLTTWSPLGGSSGACFDGIGQGCGQTGWIQMTYTVPTGGAGTYRLQFGVTNALDEDFQSGMAIAGTTINDIPITPVPVPMSLALFGVGLAGLGVVARRRR
jgi:hypothetical protein